MVQGAHGADDQEFLRVADRCQQVGHRRHLVLEQVLGVHRQLPHPPGRAEVHPDEPGEPCHVDRTGLHDRGRPVSPQRDHTEQPVVEPNQTGQHGRTAALVQKGGQVRRIRRPGLPHLHIPLGGRGRPAHLLPHAVELLGEVPVLRPETEVLRLLGLPQAAPTDQQFPFPLQEVGRNAGRRGELGVAELVEEGTRPHGLVGQPGLLGVEVGFPPAAARQTDQHLCQVGEGLDALVLHRDPLTVVHQPGPHQVRQPGGEGQKADGRRIVPGLLKEPAEP